MHGSRADQPHPSTTGKSQISMHPSRKWVVQPLQTDKALLKKGFPRWQTGHGIVKRLTLTEGKIPILESN